MASKNYIFYKIFKEDLDEVYVGSTANFYSRKKDHKRDCNSEKRKHYNLKIYKTIRENGGWDEFKMIQIGTRENITKREAEQIEEEYRLELKATMNTNRAFTTPEQMKEDYKERCKEYKQTNKDLILEYQKDYRQTNKDLILEYQKDYRQTNKEKISEQKKERIICECKCEIRRDNLSRHEKTKKHIKLMENINNI
jgi:hypothetical protein